MYIGVLPLRRVVIQIPLFKLEIYSHLRFDTASDNSISRLLARSNGVFFRRDIEAST